MRRGAAGQRGVTLIELLVTLAIAAVLLTSVATTAYRALDTSDAVQGRLTRVEEADFAFARMLRAVAHSQRLLLPRADDPGTGGHDESAVNVLALELDPTLDLDFDGVPDADNDGDGRIDEDPSNDINNDGEPGIAGVDDDNDGNVDEYSADDDDEDAGLLGALLGGYNEDPVDGIDADGDASFDEDPSGDWNGDGAPGVAGVDDDGDGSVDEGSNGDDDEDGAVSEDWIDTVVFRLVGSELIERLPVPWDTDGDLSVSGADNVESVIAANVTAFEVERLPRGSGATQLVRLRLELAVPDGAPVALETVERLGGAL